ncbi:hypothetical protein DB88DRAFT_538172 [Papiliotrema laurentii]|uniref:Uncharacterized protein n=1 Tax=Papiliotrema laurentii TaxID=5418 RepID=A0AAD9L886_PAPLA|nr:hypothetical protein DB88DRAFT_538172 [Papiliotrema laurentii]
MTGVDERSTYIDKARRKVLSRSSTLTYSDMPYCAPGAYIHGPLGVGHRPTGPSSPVPSRAAVAGPSALRAVNKRPRDSEGARGPEWDAGQRDRDEGGSTRTPVKVKHRVPIGSTLGYSAPPLTPRTSLRAVTPLPPSRVRFSALVSPDHGEVEFHLSPHALSAIDRMKQDARFQDPLKAQETQEDLFRRAASLSPARLPLTPDHGGLSAGGPSGQTRDDETSPSSGDEYGLDPPPYRSPSRAMSVGSPPRYRLFTHEPSPVVVPPQNGPRGLPPLPKRGSGQHPDLFYANTADFTAPNPPSFSIGAAFDTRGISFPLKLH